MIDPSKFIDPNRDSFGEDPFGYSTLAWHKWGLAQTVAGFPKDISKPPTSNELKDPVLWLTQANAMSEAARVLIQTELEWKHLPVLARGVCDCQYCATALMLVGYSLEICIKAMLIMQKGIEAYTKEERKFRHHRLEKLADFIPDLSEKEKSILKVLTHFVMWAGRYPDPGSGREDNSNEIIALSEKYEMSAKDVFLLVEKIMNNTQKIINSEKEFTFK